MLGLMHTLLAEYVEQRYGSAKWNDVVLAAGIDPSINLFGYETVGCPFADNLLPRQVALLTLKFIFVVEYLTRPFRRSID